MTRTKLLPLLLLLVVACNQSPPTSRPTPPPIIPIGMRLTRDSAGNSFEMFKVDLPQGSYGLRNGQLHWYAGKTIWINVEESLPNDPWKRQLKQELADKLSQQEVLEEGVRYRDDGTAEGMEQ